MAGGRPTKLTLELQHTICDAILAGNHLVSAAALAGINKTTLHAWLKRGAREASGVFDKFLIAVKQAQQEVRARGRAPIPMQIKLTTEIQQKICDAIRAGNFLVTAAVYAGVGKTALHEWLKRGANEDKGIYRDFVAGVEKANADAETRAVLLVIKSASAGSLQASTWFLERKFPHHWGRRDKLDATIKGAVAHVNLNLMDLSVLTDEELHAFETLNAKIVASGHGSNEGGESGSGGESAA